MFRPDRSRGRGGTFIEGLPHCLFRGLFRFGRRVLARAAACGRRFHIAKFLVQHFVELGLKFFLALFDERTHLLVIRAKERARYAAEENTDRKFFHIFLTPFRERDVPVCFHYATKSGRYTRPRKKYPKNILANGGRKVVFGV